MDPQVAMFWFLMGWIACLGMRAFERWVRDHG